MAITVAVPLALPESIVAETESANAAGSVIIVEAEEIHPIESVIVTE